MISYRKQRRTLEAIFTDPLSPAIAWGEIEHLLKAVGCKVIEGSGSRVKFEGNKVVAAFHRPHPEPSAKRYEVRDVREFLIKLGVRP
jgi:hypothetical protein